MAKVGIIRILLAALPTHRHSRAAYHTPKVIRPQFDSPPVRLGLPDLRSSPSPHRLLLFPLALC